MAETNSNINSSDENFVANGKIYILGPFDRTISKNVIPAFVDLIEEKSSVVDPTIEIYINSHGGYAEELLGLLAMVSIAKKAGIKIITYNIGCANSCGSILAIHGNVRKMFKDARNVMHLGCSGNEWRTFEQLDRVTRTAKEFFTMITNWYVENTKLTKKQAEEFLKDDKCSFNAQECLKYGLCDEII